jgi:aminopeptidase N
MMRRALSCFFALLLWTALPCLASQDPHSLSNPDEVRVRHLDLDISVDFDSRCIKGTATWDLQRAAGSDKIVFDTRDLDILEVTSGGARLSWKLGKSDKILGTPLTVLLPQGADRVTISYATRPEAAALQWLDPEQTAGGRYPFLYTQSEAILARTWIPCQDTPGVRFSYNARVKVPTPLMAVMSASNPTTVSADGVYTFEMPQVIPSYLMALGVGELGFRSLGRRTGIYAEPVSLDAAAYELAETEKMVDAVEKMFGEYRWGRYDMLLLPPSFPFGGMENPRLTFLTPTMIAGDRSLTSLIAHELAHSWSGNLVTNATWNDFWLNEGFTDYLERRIMEELYGADYAAMLTDIGFDDLRLALTQQAPADTRLKMDLQGRDPDAGMTDIPYEKGYFFLASLEKKVGRKRFDAFLKKWFDDHAFQSADTEEFVAAARRDLGPDLDIDAWVYSPGLPEGFTVAPSARFAAVDAELAAWNGGASASSLQTGAWTTMEWLRFLRGLPAGLTSARMAELDQAFHFTETGNSEILAQWLMSVIGSGYEPGYPALERFLVRVGRRKFLEPLYGELLKTEAGKARAREIYGKARRNYHPLAVKTMDELLGWPY